MNFINSFLEPVFAVILIGFVLFLIVAGSFWILGAAVSVIWYGILKLFGRG